MRVALICVGACLLTACASSSTIPLAQDTVQITASAAPVCGAAGAQSVAAKQAAAETIRRGYDKFMIGGAQYQNNVRVVGHTPIIANTDHFGTTSTTTFSGGSPIIGGSHDQGLIVKMFKDGDPAGANAVPARETLGPKWKDVVSNPTLTCL